MEKQFDVIVCGGGPAGSAAATVLARQGVAVALIDKAVFPRKKLCGGLLTWKSSRILETIFGETSASLSEAGVIKSVSSDYSIHTASGPLITGDLPHPFHLVDRTPFDARLLEHAKNAGVEVFEGVSVDSVDTQKGAVICKDGSLFVGKYVLGADGANSRVRRAFTQIDHDRFRKYMAPTIEIRVPQSVFSRPVDHPELYVGLLDAGYGWVFPHADDVVLGICGLKQKDQSFDDLFRHYLEILEIDIPPSQGLHGHPLPYGNYLEVPFQGSTLLAGDAAGFVEPLFGEGLFFALCSGLYAGDALCDGLLGRGDPGPRYTRRVHRQLMPELKASNRLRWALFSSVKLLGPTCLKVFVNSAAPWLAEMVHGVRSYSLLRKKHWDFL